MRTIEKSLLRKPIAVVDDEPELLAMVATILRDRGFEDVRTYASPLAALKDIQRSDDAPALFLLDVMMPEIDGIALLGEIRTLPGCQRTPAIFLTARDEPRDRLSGLESGADDYISKPFLPDELVLRMLAVLRRCYPDDGEVVDLGFCTIDLPSAEVRRPDGTLMLTAKEHDILQVLADNRGRIVTFDTIAERCWGSTFGYENTLMAHIRRLREKIEEDPSHPVSLVTVKGLGYRLKVVE